MPLDFERIKVWLIVQVGTDFPKYKRESGLVLHGTLFARWNGESKKDVAAIPTVIIAFVSETSAAGTDRS